MDYFVSIEDRTGDHWKAELLIESFKLLGIQDKLLIALCKTGGGYRPEFTRNLYAHKRVFSHKPSDLNNEIIALDWCLKNNLIKWPLTIIRKHHLIVRETTESDTEIVFSTTRELDLPKVLPDFPELGELPITMDNWAPAGETIVLPRQMPDWFMERLIGCCQKLNKPDEKITWSTALSDISTLITTRGVMDLESYLSSNDISKCSFVNYSYGLIPRFIPSLYEYENDFPFVFGANPIEILAQYAPTPAAHWANSVALSCLRHPR